MSRKNNNMKSDTLYRRVFSSSVSTNKLYRFVNDRRCQFPDVVVVVVAACSSSASSWLSTATAAAAPGAARFEGGGILPGQVIDLGRTSVGVT